MFALTVFNTSDKKKQDATVMFMMGKITKCTDFKSSNISMWPVYLLVNEPLLAARKAGGNTLFYGMWVSRQKPMMWSFLKPLHQDICTLEQGIHYISVGRS